MATTPLRQILTVLAPPLAVCRYGCARCCAAPISVFWLSGISAIVYGFLGGPANLATVSWTTVLLGIALWVIASVWAGTVIRTVDDPSCGKNQSPLCQIIGPQNDDNPLDNVKKFY